MELPVVDALKLHGFNACELHMGMKTLKDCPMPVIVQTVGRHMVITKANDFYIAVVDPSGNKIHRIAFLDFVKMWTGLVVVIEPPPMKPFSFLRRLLDL